MMLSKLPQGFQLSLIGLLLIAIFTSRLAFGIATLPLSLPRKQAVQSRDLESWRRLKSLIWFLVSLAFLPGALLSFVLIGVPFLLTSQLPSYALDPWLSRLSLVLEGIIVLGIALRITGVEGRAIARRFIQLPDLRWPLLASVFSIGIDSFISVGQYLLDRAQWAARDFGRRDPPLLGSYFHAPDIWLLLLIFGAFFEEVIFRGLLQTRFIDRYGLYRGVFLVGVVWAAYHFFPDFSFSHFTYQEVLAKLCFRTFNCVALSFVLAWLTLRSESVVPATIAHTLYNVLVSSPIGPIFVGKGVLRVALWAVLAYALFRYWPVPSEGDLVAATTIATTEPAT